MHLSGAPVSAAVTVAPAASTSPTETHTVEAAVEASAADYTEA